MRIAVAVRAVLDGPPAGRLVDATAAPSYRFNEHDDQALEAAIELKESGGASVTAVSVSPPPQAEPALRRALALGADEALALWDEALAGADTAATASVLAQLFGKLEARLVLFGERSADTGGGALPAYVAELLGWPFAGQTLALSIDGGTLSARRRLPAGYRQAVQCELPAVVGMASAAQPVRYPKVADQLRADRARVNVRRPDELGVDLGGALLPSRVRVERLTLPKPACLTAMTALHPLPEVRVALALAEAGARNTAAQSGAEAIRAALRTLIEAGVIPAGDTRGDR